MCFQPVGSAAALCCQRYLELYYTLHLFPYQFHDGHPVHGYLDDVRRAALYRGVDGVAFGESTDRGVARIDILDVSFPSEDGGYISLLSGLSLGALNVVRNGGIVLEVSVNQFLGLFSRDVQSLGQTEGGDAVDDAEVGGLGPASLLGSDILQSRPR